MENMKSPLVVITILFANVDNTARRPTLWRPIDILLHYWASGLALNKKHCCRFRFVFSKRVVQPQPSQPASAALLP